ncbi:MAG TPA: DoxX family protein [Terriglobales bacterium]|nr:DoxX family protein [Terriglobales bacterium]
MFEQLLPYTPYLALLLRVVVGVTMVMHGYPKLKNPKQTIGWTKGLGVPVVATWLAIILEFFGGIALIIGLIVPIVAFFIMLEMIGNVSLKKTKMKSPYIAGQNPAAYEIDITYLLLAVTLIVLGAGIFSIDALLGL